MAHHLVLALRLYEDSSGIVRYHGIHRGVPEWPPSPARVYQALVAGAARGNALPGTLVPAFEWLESLDPPTIAAPRSTRGQKFTMFVPNNDADVVPNPRDVSGVRVAKFVDPRLFPGCVPIFYIWSLAKESPHATTIASVAREVYQLGRGIDMAWAVGGILDDASLQTLLANYPGTIHQAVPFTQSELMLPCPVTGSLSSLIQRHRATKLRVEKANRKTRTFFINPPKPRFQTVSYHTSPTRFLFELRDTAKPDLPFTPWPLKRVVELVQAIRGVVDDDAGIPQSGAAARLWSALPHDQADISLSIIGRNAREAEKARRIRILPLPSIGHVHVNQAIRRVLVEIPPACPLSKDDIAWAFSGLEVVPSIVDPETGELQKRIQLIPAGDYSPLRHYGIRTKEGSRMWRSVTPLALTPSRETGCRNLAGPIPPQWNGKERSAEEQRVVAAVLNALRHAGVRSGVVSVRIQREPFDTKGTRAEFFSPGTRFAKERLWHAEIQFTSPVEGPLVLGDGRYLGLGLMRPVDALVGIQAFRIVDGLTSEATPMIIAAALRRAVMSRVQERIGERKRIPTFFSGHEHDGEPARGDAHHHIFFVVDIRRKRLLVMAPHVVEHRDPTREEKRHLALLASSLSGFKELRAGAAGKLDLAPDTVREGDALLGPSTSWRSVTDYRVTRHRKKKGDRDALIIDAISEIRRRNLPSPKQIDVEELVAGPKGGIKGYLRIEFAMAVKGPIILGRTCHNGGGLFESLRRHS